MADLLRVEGLSAAYGKFQVLFDVSLRVAPGELVALIGSNGAGKSTLLKSISGWLPPRAGRVLFAGQEIAGRRADEIVRLGVAHCPEGRRVFRDLTVLENLQMGAYARQGDGWKKDLARVFERFPRLGERAHQLAGSLSGGEQQMLAIGRALMAAPRLILFDEPSLGLAPVLVEAMFAAIRQVQREGTTVLLVEQNARLALRLADRAYVLENGHIVREGAGSELLADEQIERAYLGVA